MGNYCYAEPTVPQGDNMLSVPVGHSPGYANKLCCRSRTIYMHTEIKIIKESSFSGIHDNYRTIRILNKPNSWRGNGGKKQKTNSTKTIHIKIHNYSLKLLKNTNRTGAITSKFIFMYLKVCWSLYT